MAKIRSGATTDELTIDPTSKAARVTLYKSSGVEIVLTVDSTSNALRTTLYDTSGNPSPTAIRVPRFHGDSGNLTVQATAHAVTAGFLWLINPVGSSKVLRIRNIRFMSAPTAVTVFSTSPRVTVERITFTGTSSGAQIIPAKTTSGLASNTGLLVTANTGLTITSGAIIASFVVTPILTAVGLSDVAIKEWTPSPEMTIELVAGEGIVIRQPDAGSTTDTRKIIVDISWQEE